MNRRPMAYRERAAAYGSAGERPALTNAQHEPPYPGDPTVVFSMRAPGITAHMPTKLCSIEEPHDIASCSEWSAAEITNNPRQKVR